MEKDILEYYEQELDLVKRTGIEFAKTYPKIAGRLFLEPGKCEDPHTERLIEALALLGGRVRKKIDDGLPEMTEAMLNIVYPHYLNPIPSMSVVRFEALETVPPSGYHIAPQTPLLTKPVKGSPCRFRTGYPLTIWPVEVVSAKLLGPRKHVPGARQSLNITVKTRNNIDISNLNWENIRFFLNGPGNHAFHLRELLLNNVCHIEYKWKNRQDLESSVTLKPGDIGPVGFDNGERLIPHPPRSFPGYLLLFEYFAFPEKFLFFDLKGFGRLRTTDIGDTLEIWIHFDRTAAPDLVINADTFCLHAVPLINLFKCIAEPIPENHRKTEYRVVPRVGNVDSTEVFSIDKVISSSGNHNQFQTIFKPFYSIYNRLTANGPDGANPFWSYTRKSSGRLEDKGTDVYLSFLDPSLATADPETESVIIHATCTNRDLPSYLPFGDLEGDFDVETGNNGPLLRAVCLIKPTPSRRPAAAQALQWRLISHLSLNYTSFTEGGARALKEMLKLYDFNNSPATKQQIAGIASLQSEYVSKRIGHAFCRGAQITVEFDESKYVGTGVFLLASVLERFFGEYVSVNSFSQMIAKTTKQNQKVLKKWPARNGNRILH